MSMDLSVLTIASGNGVKAGTASSVSGKAVLPQNAGKNSAFAQFLNANVQSDAQGKTAGKEGAGNFLLQNLGKKTALDAQGLQNDLAGALKVSKVDDEGADALVGAAITLSNPTDFAVNTKTQTGKAKPSPLSSLILNTNGAERKAGEQNAQLNPGQIRRSVVGGGAGGSSQLDKAPAITAGPVVAELKTKGVIAPQPSTSPAIQSGPIVAGQDPKTITIPQPATAPAIEAGPVVAGLDPKSITPPQPSTSPAIQNGPVVAELDPKNITTPVLSRTPVVQNGPVVAGLGQKEVTAPRKSGAPAIKAGPVIAELTANKNTGTQLSGLMQGLVSPEELQQKATRTRGSGNASSKVAIAKGGQARAGGKSGAGNAAAQAANPGNPSTGTAPFNSSNAVLAQATLNQALNSQERDVAGSSFLKGAPSSFAGITDAGLDGRTVLAGTQTDQLLKPTQTHDIAQKGASLSQHNSPRLDQASLAGFAASMAQRVQGGGTRFEIRLDPAALGKIQVKLEVSADNRVEAVLSTHRPEVLADLQRGADALRRALSDMGFELGSGGLSFSLEQETGGFETDQDSTPGLMGVEGAEPDESLDPHSAILAQSDRGYGLTRVFDGRVDVKL